VNAHSKLLKLLSHKKYRIALTCLLLATVGYGTLVESVHSHGCPWGNNSNVTTAYDKDGPESSHHDHAHSFECPLCQLQRQLFGGFVHAVLLARPLTQIAFSAQEPVFYLSTSIFPSSGRAPPLSLNQIN
jgi:hypothetical protein